MAAKATEATPLTKAEAPKKSNADAGKPFWAKPDPASGIEPKWYQVGPTATVALSLAVQMSFGVGMSITNKYLTNFIPMPCTVTACQMLFTGLTLVTLFFKQLHFGSWADTIRWAYGPPLLYGLQLSSSMIGTWKLSLATQINVRNLGPFISIPIERFITERGSNTSKISYQQILALLVTTLGVGLFFASATATPPDGFGVLWILGNMVITIFCRLVERRYLHIEKLELSISSGLLMNNMIGLIPVIIVGCIQQEFKKWPDFPDTQWQGYFFLALSCCLGLGLGWTGIMLQKQITATAMLIVINSNKFIVIFYAMAFMGEDSSPPVLVGCTFALIGSAYFAYASLRIKTRQGKEIKQLEEYAPGIKFDDLMNKPENADKKTEALEKLNAEKKAAFNDMGCCDKTVTALDEDIC